MGVLNVEGDYGYCLFVDCLDPDYGMPSLGDKTTELCWSDPPWGQEYDGQNTHGTIKSKAHHPNRINYNDKFDPAFNLAYFPEMLRVSKAVIATWGWKHYYWWIRNFEPIAQFFLVFKNGQGSNKVAKYNGVCPYLCYGDEWWKKHKFHRNFHETFIYNGFMRKYDNLVHPSPKDSETWIPLMRELKPKSLLDPFMGSGLIAEIGESLGIQWLGFEIEPRYYADVEFRVKLGQKYRKSMRTRRLLDL